MKQSGHFIKQVPVKFADVRADRAYFDACVADMRQHGGSLVPSPNWLALDRDIPVSEDSEAYLEDAFSDKAFATRFSSLYTLLDGYLGQAGMRPLDARDEAAIARYDVFLSRFDPLNLWPENIRSPKADLVSSDLGSLLELNLIYGLAENRDTPRTTFLEVGGGYGRLAEAAFNVFGDSIRYVLVDSVPASLAYAKLYMEKACPQLRIGSFYDGDPFDLEKFHCYVIPSWHFEKQNSVQYDVGVNIYSMQEMSQQLVDHYIGLFDRVTAPNGLIYLSNARDYCFRGNWNFPKHWQQVLCANTPRTWIQDHATEVFLKKEGDFSLPNAALDAQRIYTYQTMTDNENIVTEPGVRASVHTLVRAVKHRIGSKG